MHRCQIFALLATASAFAPPRGHAPQRTTLGSMDEDATYEAPSDSTTIDDVIDVEQSADDRDADALKRELLIKMSASARGQAKSEYLNDDVEEIASRLEATRPSAVSLDDVRGRWSLGFCSTQLFRSSPFWMAGRATCKDGKEAERYDWFCEMHRKATMVSEIGAVRQIISEDALVSEFETTVAAFPMRVGGAMPLNILGSIVSSASIVAERPLPAAVALPLTRADSRSTSLRLSRDNFSARSSRSSLEDSWVSNSLILSCSDVGSPMTSSLSSHVTPCFPKSPLALTSFRRVSAWASLSAASSSFFEAAFDNNSACKAFVSRWSFALSFRNGMRAARRSPNSDATSASWLFMDS